MRDSASLKKALARDEYWETIKEILGWMIDTNRGNLALSSKKRPDLISLLDIPNSQRHKYSKKLERFIGKLRSIHFAMTGVIWHFYTMQVTLTCTRAGKRSAVKLSARFHQDIKLWSNMCIKMTDHPTYLTDLFHQPGSDLGCTNALGIVQGGYG